MNYAYLGDRLSAAAAENFPVFLTTSAPAPRARRHPADPLVLDRRPAHEHESPARGPSRLLDPPPPLESWYRRDRDAAATRAPGPRTATD